MIEAKGDLFDQLADAVVITTNGFVKSNGECVMGRGCALQAAKMDPSIPARLGRLIKEQGNRVIDLGHLRGMRLFTFPVKPIETEFNGSNAVGHMRSRFEDGDMIPGWASVADMDIIRASALQLRDAVDELSLGRVVMPRPGCGAGELNWSIVKLVLGEVLDDRFTVMSLK